MLNPLNATLALGLLTALGVPGPRASAQSACTPPMIPTTFSPAAYSVNLYIASLGHLREADSLINEGGNVLAVLNDPDTPTALLRLRQAVAALHCAERLVAMPLPTPDSIFRTSLTNTDTLLRAITNSVEGARALLVSVADSKLVRTAATADRIAEYQVQIKTSLQNLLSVSTGLVASLKRSNGVTGLSAIERDSVLSTIRMSFGRRLSEADAKASYVQLAAYMVQLFLARNDRRSH